MIIIIKYNLKSFSQWSAWADDDVAGLDVEVDAASPLDVVERVQDLGGDVGNHLKIKIETFRMFEY